jgi:hypothetical protein
MRAINRLLNSGPNVMSNMRLARADFEYIGTWSSYSIVFAIQVRLRADCLHQQPLPTT